MNDSKVKSRRVFAAGLVACFALSLGLAGCSSGSDTASDFTEGVGSTVADVANMDFEYTDREMDPSYDEASATRVSLEADGAVVEGEGAAVEGSTVTISSEGTYVVSGELTDGSLVVDADGAKVQVVLDGASIHNESGPALRVVSADKVFITLAEGSQNSLSDGASYNLAEGEDEPNAVLYSKADLALNGSGRLFVSASYAHAVNSKDDLVITGGTYEVEAVEDGLRGKDCVKIAGGDFSVKTGGDAIKSNNDEDPTRGFVSIDGGSFFIEAGDDGIDAYTYFRVMDGSIELNTADDAFHSDGEALVAGGSMTVNAGDDAFHAEYVLSVDGGTIDVQSCTEGLEAEKVYVNDGDVHIVASDDGLNAAAAETATADGEEDVVAGDDVANGDVPALPDGMPEGSFGEGSGADPGTNAEPPALPEAGSAPGDGVEPPDGFSGETGKPGGGAGGGEAPEPSEGMRDFDGQERGELELPDGVEGGVAGAAMPGASDDCLIQINGGYLVVDAGGDGIDSNGSVEVNGGVVLVEGPASSADSALDYETTASITGGTVLMVGQMGMAMGFSEGTQASAMVQASGEAGQSIAVTDESGEVLVSYLPKRSYQVAVVSAPGMTDGGGYNVVVGGAVENANADGFADSGTVAGGSSLQFTASLEASNAGFGGMGMAGGMDMGGRGFAGGGQGSEPKMS